MLERHFRLPGKEYLRMFGSVFIVLLASFTIGSLLAIAAPPGSKFTPGETLDPGCAPGDLNCSVDISSSSTLWLDAGAFVYPQEGDSVAAPYINATSTTATSTFSGGLTVGSLDIGNLSGVLQATGGYVTAGAVGVTDGGTGLTSAPGYGQLLLGQADGSYDLVATSSLGIVGTSDGFSPFAWTPVSYGNATSTTLGFLDGFISTASSTVNALLQLPQGADLAGSELILDADGDTSITVDTDDTVDFRIGGTDIVTFTGATPINQGTFDIYGAWFREGQNLIGTNDTHFLFNSGGDISGTQASVVTMSGNGALADDKAAIVNIHQEDTNSTDGYVLRLEADDADVDILQVEGAGEVEVFTITNAGVASSTGLQVNGNGAFTGTLTLPSLTAGQPLALNASNEVVSSSSLSTAFIENLSGTNTGDVTLAGALDYITIAGQVITRNAIDLATDVTGVLDISDNTNLTVGATGIELSGDNIALTAGYNIPLTASTTNWNTFYDTPSTRITAGTNLSWSGNTLNAIGGGGGSNWSFDTTFGETSLTPSTTIPVWAKDTFYASSTLEIGTGDDTWATSTWRSDNAELVLGRTNIDLSGFFGSGAIRVPVFYGSSDTQSGLGNIAGLGANDSLVIFEDATRNEEPELSFFPADFSSTGQTASLRYATSTDTIEVSGADGGLLIESGILDVDGTGTSTFNGGIQIQTGGLRLLSSIIEVDNNTATSTFNGGLFGSRIEAGNLGNGAVISEGGMLVNGTVGVSSGGTGTTTQITNGVTFYDGARITSTEDFVFASGNLGVGTTAPTYKLSVDGFVNVDEYSGYKQAGNTILYASSTNFSTLVGNSAGSALTSSNLYNTALGYQALKDQNNGNGNVALGYQALLSATSSIESIAIGYRALSSGSGDYNVAIGSDALRSNISGLNNVAIGTDTLTANTTGSYNVAVSGYRTLRSNTTGSNNIALGYNILDANTTGTSNVGIGAEVLGSNTTGSDNLAIGAGSAVMSANEDGSDNIVIGGNSLNSNISGSVNVVLGRSALATSTTGSSNIAIGFQAGNTQTGSENIFIGNNASVPDTAGDRQLSIGNLIYGQNLSVNSNIASLGTIGIASSTPYARLSVAGVGTGTGVNFQTTNSNNVPLFTILDNGRVGVGTTSPARLFGVNGGSYFGGNTYTEGNATTTGTGRIGTLVLDNALGVTYGGTGLSTAPTYGQLLLGQADGSYSLVATSSLGISGGGGGSGDSFAWTPSTTYGNSVNATSSKLWLQDALYASSTLTFGSSNAWATTTWATSKTSLTLDTTNFDLAVFGGGTLNFPTFYGLDDTGSVIGVSAGVGFNDSVVVLEDATRNAFPQISFISADFETTGRTGTIQYSTSSDAIQIASADGGLQVTTGVLDVDGSATSTFNGGIKIENGGLDIDSGVIEVDNNTATSTFGGGLFGARIEAGNLGNGAVISEGGMLVNGIVGVAYGGTGLSSAPTYGQLLLGQADGSYNLVATSTLGITGSSLWDQSGSDIYYNAGSVGIGNTNPSFALDVSGSVNIGATDSFKQGGTTVLTASTSNDTLLIGLNAGASFIGSGSNNLAIGTNALSNATSTAENLAIGLNALQATTWGSNNLAFGVDALGANTTGINNIAIGNQVLQTSTSTSNNVGIGDNVMILTTGDSNVGVGNSALQANTTGRQNTMLGGTAGTSNTTGDNNVAVGNFAFKENTTGSDNVAVGHRALLNSVTGGANVAIGRDAGVNNTSATSTIFIGYRAGQGLVSGYTSQNGIYIGTNAGRNLETGSDNNTFIGYQSGLEVTSGSNNILFGYQAGDNITTGSNNLLLGHDIDAQSATLDNQLSIGNLIFGTGIDGTGTTVSTGNIGIGTTTPFERLTVSGNVYIDGSATTTGDFAIGDPDGLHAVWRTLNFGAIGNILTIDPEGSGGGLVADGAGIAIRSGLNVVENEDSDQNPGITFLAGDVASSFNLGQITYATTSQVFQFTKNIQDGFGIVSSASNNIMNFVDGTIEAGLCTACGDAFMNISSPDAIGTAGKGVLSVRTGANDTRSLTYGLFVDTNARLGTGTTTPLAQLSVQGEGTTTGLNFQTYNSNGSPLFTILDNGQVGIGTTTSTEVLQVNGRGIFGLEGTRNDSGTYLHVIGGNGETSGSIHPAAEELVIENAGNVGLTLLTNATGNSSIAFNNGSNTLDGSVTYDHSADTMTLRNNNSPTLTLQSSNSVEIANLPSVGSDPMCWDGTGASIIGDCSSLGKYKTNQVAYGAGLAEILELEPKTFDWKRFADGSLSDTDEYETLDPDTGFIADDVAAVNEGFGRYNNEGELLDVNERGIMGALVNAIKELYEMVQGIVARNDEQDERLEILEQENQILKERLDALDGSSSAQETSDDDNNSTSASGGDGQSNSNDSGSDDTSSENSNNTTATSTDNGSGTSTSTPSDTTEEDDNSTQTDDTTPTEEDATSEENTPADDTTTSEEPEETTDVTQEEEEETTPDTTEEPEASEEESEPEPDTPEEPATEE